MKIKKRLVALLAGISLLSFGVFMSCDNPSGVDKKDETEITNTKDGEDKKTTDTEKTTDKDKTGDKNTSSDKDKSEDKQNNSGEGEEKSTETDDNGKEKGGESDGEESDVAEETTLSVGNSSIAIKSTADGIKFEWDTLPDNTEYIEIQTWWDELRDYIAYYRCQNPSEVKSFTDEFVTADEEYKYKVLFYSTTGLINKDSNEITIKAKGGKGELSINIEATEEGIKLSGVKYHESEDSMFGIFKNEKGHLIARNPSSIDSFTGKSFEYVDKYVDADTEYEYRAVEAFNGYIAYPRYKTQTVKAIGGLGSNQIKLTATPTDKGINFQWEKAPAADDISRIWLRLDPVDSKDIIEIGLNDSSVTSFTAEYIDVGKSYNCYIYIYQKNETSLMSNSVTVKASAGLGEARLTNSPVATFDGAESINFTTVPTVSLPSNAEWQCEFRYNDDLRTENNGHMYTYSSNGNSRVVIDKVRTSGTWRFKCYRVNFDLDDCFYHNYCYDISELNGIPNPIVLSDENRFTFTATPVSDGIKLEWKNLPEGTKHIAIFPQSEKQAKFLVHNLADIHYVIDKHVEAGKKYSYCLSLRNEEGLEFGDSRYSGTIIATAGLGETEVLTATASADGIHLSVQKPASDYDVWIYKSSAENPDVCKEWFDIGGNKIPDSVTEINFTDTFVTAGKEYIYKVSVEPRSYQDKDIIEILHYKSVKVKSISTGEKLVITNQPAGTYDEATKKLTLTTKPEITPVDGIDSWDISLDYNRQSGASSGYGIFEIKETTDTREAWSGAGNGMFYLCAYRIWLYFDNYVRYHVENSDISNLSGLPQSVKL